MHRVKLPYYKFRTAPNPIDKHEYCYRPFLSLRLQIGTKLLNTKLDALIDSGADYNMAPVELASLFNVDLSKYPYTDVGGIEQTNRVKLYFVPVTMWVEDKAVHTHMGFGGNLPYILLGQRGFFDKLKEVTLRYPKYVELKFK